MKKHCLTVFIACLLIACNGQNSLGVYGKTLFTSLKEHDLKSFEKLSLTSNKHLRYEVDTLLREPISVSHEKERRDNIKKNFLETRQELIDRGCIWDQAKFLGFNYNLEVEDGGYKMYTGELIFESNAKQFKLNAGRIIQKGDGNFYFMGSFPLTIMTK